MSNNPTPMTPQDNDLSTTVDAHVENIRYTLQDEHAISQEAVEHLKMFVQWLIAKERRAAAEAMQERAATHFENYKSNHVSGYLTNEDIAYHAPEIAEMIRALPLDTPDDGRG